MAGLCRIPVFVGHQSARVAGDGHERRAQIMGNAAQQIGAEPFHFRQDSRRLLFPRVFLVLHGQRAFAKHGDQRVLRGDLRGRLLL